MSFWYANLRLYVYLWLLSYLSLKIIIYCLSKSKEYVFLHNLECDPGTFGEHCNESCGHCLNNASCNHVDGMCLTGCAAGYQRNLCKMGKPG